MQQHPRVSMEMLCFCLEIFQSECSCDEEHRGSWGQERCCVVKVLQTEEKEPATCWVPRVIPQDRRQLSASGKSEAP